MVGVQWHPEDTAESDPAQQSLFDALALLARMRGSRARDGQTVGRSRDYRLEEPDPAWPTSFEEESHRIRGALGAAALRIDHVGSTSVPGLAAKPIVDIQVSLATLEPRDDYVPALERLGYRHTLDPIRPDREYFSRDVDARAPVPDPRLRRGFGVGDRGTLRSATGCASTRTTRRRTRSSNADSPPRIRATSWPTSTARRTSSSAIEAQALAGREATVA